MRAEQFRALHQPGRPLLIANPWDAGSARLLAAIGFQALATSSSGFAGTLGRLDYGVTREEAIAHAAAVVAAVDVPVSADLEDCFGDPAGTVRMAVDAGLAGCSIEDWDGERLLPIDEAAARVAEAVGAADGELLITARAETFTRGRPDVAETIARLQAYEVAGADVLFAPLADRAEVLRELVTVVGRPVNVLARAGVSPVAELAELGVARISVGSGFAFAALGAAADVARELLEHGTYGFADAAARGAAVARPAFGS
ncbi:MAG TPA: isocitrate lyase/phosphoenolpyruvate mutase family protein [Solirubrobacteraceae bacterium]|jgi:2-methylisocitrate lyase-like PEP mutase family enzyme|nr:isocitrate lyase/phosphoenolpyruvate mutase family protein [Solirubrobacteraceae bacterium]